MFITWQRFYSVINRRMGRPPPLSAAILNEFRCYHIVLDYRLRRIGYTHNTPISVSSFLYRQYSMAVNQRLCNVILYCTMRMRTKHSVTYSSILIIIVTLRQTGLSRHL